MTDENKITVIDRRVQEPPAKVPAQNEFFAMVERLSRNPDVDVQKLEQIVKMQEHILDRNAEQAFNAAMTRAQNRIELVVADSTNEQTKSRYAQLKTVLIKAKPIYTEEGFSLMFYEGVTDKPNHKRICVDVMHEQGHTKSRYVDLAIQTTGIAGKSMMTEIHGEGSSFSYGRRYLTCMIFNIPTGDDDGNAAGGAKQAPVYLTQEQRELIKNRVEKLKLDKAVFLEFFEADDFEHLLAKDFPRMQNKLNRTEEAKKP